MPENNILTYLYKNIEKSVVEGATHQYYKRTVDLAVRYQQLITGENIDSLLHQFVKREDEAMFKQRKRMTQAITPSACSSVMHPFYKVGRTNNITKKIIFKKDEVSKTVKINNAIATFWGEKSLEQYLQTRFTELSFSDPNAFIITEFDEKPNELGVMENVPKPRAFEAYSENVVDFDYDNNILEWVIVKLPVEYKEDNVKKAGVSFTIYGKEWSIKFTQISIKGRETIAQNLYVEAIDNEGKNVKIYRANEKDIYIVEEFNHKAKEVPAIRVGYKSDLHTNGVTCVNPFHDGLAYLMKSVKTVSEFDLTISLHTFPQKFMYAPRCMGESQELGCSNGMTALGKTCNACKGTGMAIHTSAQDAIIMRLPKEKDSMLDLDKLVYYAQPPIDIVKFQNEYILQLKEEFYKAVFNSELVSKNEVAKTATGENIDLQNIYDTLFPYAEHYADVFRHVTKISSYYIDIDDANVIYNFPKDFKFRSVESLLNELKLANESNAPGYVREELSNDIAEAQFIDKPEELAKIKIKHKFFPFSDKTDTEILYIVSNGLTSKYKEVLWANFGDIFTEIEESQIGKTFYLLPYEKQKTIVDAKVNELIINLDKQEALGALPFGQTDSNGVAIETPIDIEAEAKAKLKGTVGGVQGILEIQKSVSEGTTDYESAITLLNEIYGYEDKVARAIIGKPKKIKVDEQEPVIKP